MVDEVAAAWGGFAAIFDLDEGFDLEIEDEGVALAMMLSLVSILIWKVIQFGRESDPVERKREKRQKIGTSAVT